MPVVDRFWLPDIAWHFVARLNFDDNRYRQPYAHQNKYTGIKCRLYPDRLRQDAESKVIGYHAFRNTLIPLVTILGGSLPGLFSGALITETLFSIRGIGYTSFESMKNGDIPFTMFYLAFVTILTLLGTLIADILYAVVDPRVRVN